MAQGDARQYLISFLATLKGEKAVIKGLRQMERSVAKTRKEMGLATKTTRSFAGGFAKIASRALLTIPVWLLLRTTFMLLLRTIGDMIRTNVELQDKFARIKTVVSASSQSVGRDMMLIKTAIMEVAVTTRRSVLELADAFYFLRTANLSTEEAISAFIPTVNLMVGTLGNAQQTARAVAGIYNTMKERIGENLSVSETFAKISDVLAFTYATQDVQMGELIQSYTKLAPFVTGLEEDFTELITILGFLNTRMLRSGRAGRLLGRTILQIVKNSHKLAEIFNITFDPNKPISLLRVLKGINKTIQGGTELSFKQQKALQQIFATRGAVAPKLLLPDLTELIEQIERAKEGADDFGEKMREIMEATVPAQMARMKNIFVALWDAFATGVTATSDLTEALTKFNDNMAKQVTDAENLGLALAYVDYRLKEYTKSVRIYNGMAIDTSDVKSMEEFVQEWANAKAKMAGVRAEQGKIQKQVADNEKSMLMNAKREKQILTRNLAIMKAQGASQLDLARYKLQYLEDLRGQSEEEKHILEIQKAQDKVLQAKIQAGQKLVDVFNKAELDYLKIRGASEIHILEAKERQLVANRKNMKDHEFLVRLTKLRFDQQKAILKLRQKEIALNRDLAFQFAKGGMFEQERIIRLSELLSLEPTQLLKTFKKNAGDKRLILKEIGRFNVETQNLIAEEIRKQSKGRLKEIKIPDVSISAKEFKIDLDKLIPKDKIGEFWKEWKLQGITATDIIMDRMIERIKEGFAFPDKKKPTKEFTEEETKEGLEKSRRKLFPSLYEITPEDIEEGLERSKQRIKDAYLKSLIPTPEELRIEQRGINMGINRRRQFEQAPFAPVRPVDINVTVNIGEIVAEGLTDEAMAEAVKEGTLKALDETEVQKKIDTKLQGL